MRQYLIATVLLAALTTPALAAADHYVVQDSSGYCAVLDAHPSKIPGLKTLGKQAGYDTRDAAEQGPSLSLTAKLRVSQDGLTWCQDRRL